MAKTSATSTAILAGVTWGFKFDNGAVTNIGPTQINSIDYSFVDAFHSYLTYFRTPDGRPLLDKFTELGSLAAGAF